MQTPFQLSQFQPLTQRFRKIDWNIIKKVDLELIKRENDIPSLESFLAILHQGFIKEKEYDELDPDLSTKYMKLIQMTIQYQEYVRQYQITMHQQIDLEETKNEDETQQLESSLKKSKKKIEKFKEDLKIEKETLARFKEKVKNQTVYACYFCTRKVFATLNDLNNHYKRRHENETPKPQENQTENLLAAQTILLQNQIAQMLSAQTQQNQQLSQLQQTAYFTLIGDNEDQSSEEDEENIDIQKIEFEKRLQQMKKDQINRETLMATKLKEMEIQFKQSQTMYQQQIETLQIEQQKLQQQALIQSKPIKSVNNSFSQKESQQNKSQDLIKKPTEQIYQYNAGELEDDSESSIQEDSKFSEKQQSEEHIHEELEEEEPEVQSNELEKLLNEQTHQEQEFIENINEAGFLAQEKELFSLLKKRKQYGLGHGITQQQKNDFRQNNLKESVETFLNKKLNINNLNNMGEDELKKVLFNLRPQLGEELQQMEKQIKEASKGEDLKNQKEDKQLIEEKKPIETIFSKNKKESSEPVNEKPLIPEVGKMFEKFRQNKESKEESPNKKSFDQFKENKPEQEIKSNSPKKMVLEIPPAQKEQSRPYLLNQSIGEQLSFEDNIKSDNKKKFMREKDDQNKPKNLSYEESFEESQKKNAGEEAQQLQQQQQVKKPQKQVIDQQKIIHHKFIKNNKNQIKETFKLDQDSLNFDDDEEFQNNQIPEDDEFAF